MVSPFFATAEKGPALQAEALAKAWGMST